MNQSQTITQTKSNNSPHNPTLVIRSKKKNEENEEEKKIGAKSKTDFWAEYYKGTEVEKQAHEAVKDYASLKLQQARNVGLSLIHDNVMMGNAIEEMKDIITDQAEKNEELESENIHLTDQRDYLRQRVGISTPELEAAVLKKNNPIKRSREDKNELFKKIISGRKNMSFLKNL